MQRKYIWLGITALFLLVGFTLTRTRQQPNFQNPVINPAVPAAEINLSDDRGGTFRMSAERGKVVLLYFGFTNCPDECPLTMAHIKQAFEILGPLSQNVRVVMVSTDPQRDSAEALKKFLGSFNPDFVGIPGSEAQLGKVWKDYGVQVLDGGETHSSYTYVIDRKGSERLTFTPESSPANMAADIKILLNEN